MKFPLRSTVQIGRYVASQKGNDRYPLVIMLEPTLGCNIACIGCGKIREYESNKARLTVEECLHAAVECPAPVISICGGEPLIFKGIEDVVAGFLEMKRNIQLCTNALRLVDMLPKFEPNPRLTFVVHLDGMQEIHDYICDYPGLWEVAVDAIKAARDGGFRVTTNTTIFKETDVDDVLAMMGYLTDEVGIDGMLVAPGYQYSQIDPNLTMTRAEHEEKFRFIRDGVRRHGYKWLASPVYQDFLTGDRKLPCAPWGSVTRNPYGWKGPCYLLTDGIFPTYEALLNAWGTDYAQVRHENVSAAALERFFPRGYRRRVLDNEQSFDLEGVKGRLLSSSYVPTEGHPNYGPMLQELERIFHEHAEAGRVRFEYDTEICFWPLVPPV
jgi:hopanoid biosynthesis associated radical SAM protein HpnH